jgi:hypothetical protein
MATDEDRSTRNADQPVIYQIRIQGQLGLQWTDWFDGMVITLEEDGNTLLSGPVVDQSALHGILKKIRNLGMPLLSVNSIDLNQATGTDTDQVKGGV